MSAPAVKASCIICFGSGVWSQNGETCQSCAGPDVAAVRKALGMLAPKHMAFLRAFHHTLAYQPVTTAEYQQHGDAFFVEDDDAVISDDFELLIPATKIWFGGGMARLAHGDVHHWIKYNPLGLALRDCIMAGSDAADPVGEMTQQARP